jgi:hypothetical protein
MTNLAVVGMAGAKNTCTSFQRPSFKQLSLSVTIQLAQRSSFNLAYWNYGKAVRRLGASLLVCSLQPKKGPSSIAGKKL